MVYMMKPSITNSVVWISLKSRRRKAKGFEYTFIIQKLQVELSRFAGLAPQFDGIAMLLLEQEKVDYLV